MRTLGSLALLLTLLVAPVQAEPAQPTVMADDGDLASLKQAVARTRTYLSGLKRPSLTLGDRQVPVEQLRRSADRFAELLERHGGTPEFERAVQAEFEWVSMPGTDGQGKVHFTGYHLPQLEAREKPDATFRFPLYAAPSDMVSIALGPFRTSLAGQTLLGRVQGNQVVPYFSRSEIDDGRALEGRGLEIAWVSDELARYSLMIQGSGLLRYGDGRIVNVNYAAQNGHAYSSLGKHLVADGKIPQALVSMPAIEAYFKTHPTELRGYLNRNASYIFFRLAPEGPYGCDGIPLTAGRAIATDKRLFPSGAIAYIAYPKATFDDQGRPTRWETGGRFVCDQDTGGAILGPGRIDIYWGGGEEAARRAGTLNGEGRAHYLLLKPAPTPGGPTP